MHASEALGKRHVCHPVHEQSRSRSTLNRITLVYLLVYIEIDSVSVLRFHILYRVTSIYHCFFVVCMHNIAL